MHKIDLKTVEGIPERWLKRKPTLSDLYSLDIEDFDALYCTSYINDIFMYNIISDRLKIPYDVLDKKYLENVWKRVYPGIGTKITLKFKNEINKFPYVDGIEDKEIFLELFNKTTISPFYIGHKVGSRESDILNIYFLIDEDVDFKK